jgi:hypothetical protein
LKMSAAGGWYVLIAGAQPAGPYDSATLLGGCSGACSCPAWNYAMFIGPDPTEHHENTNLVHAI